MNAYATLLRDLEAEGASLDVLVAELEFAAWRTPTPAEGWDVHDSVAHLAATEEWAVVALIDPDRFRSELAAFSGDPERRAEEVASGLLGRRPPSEIDALAWWREARTAMVAQLRAQEPKDRVPWFGPDMSAMSFATARLMEAWAHGEDIADALGVARVATARIRHVAELGVRTRGFDYVSRGLTMPDVPVRVDLVAPDGGDVWSWGAAEASDSVLGPALDFCLVVTQRRNPADTDLTITGPAAQEWMGIAQAFAGAPTTQRPPRASD